ncbi:hypothetical protein NliqN6_4799 [Naganishia liquefaciens]|uniref:Mediator of RNA polymerase II transcription subunit 7 n=1 Tax=Naganishia liquefaciens TaxID=104408 RepID=A0A8H3TWG7_9TREE|nr:hypothetical protein NliqN6_4799 [Naganishia liquefaciens]
MDPIETAGNADAGPSQPRPADSQPANITVLANRRFPVPPSYYTEFTPERWKKSQRLRAAGALPGKGKEKASEGIITDTEESYMNVDAESDEQSHQRTDVNDLAIFRPPRLDWVKRETTWNAFGRVYQRRPKALTAEQLGIPNFKPQDVELSDKQYMHLLLRSIIHTKLKLLETYTKSVRPTYVLEQHFGIPHEGEHYVQHMSNLAATMLTIANGLRETQARLTLELTIRRQIDRRKEQTRVLREKCAEIAARLTSLQQEVHSSGVILIAGAKGEEIDSMHKMDLS